MAPSRHPTRFKGTTASGSRRSDGNVRLLASFVRYRVVSRISRLPAWTAGFEPERSLIADASAGWCYDIRTVCEPLGHGDIKTTMVCIYVLNRGLSG